MLVASVIVDRTENVCRLIDDLDFTELAMNDERVHS